VFSSLFFRFYPWNAIYEVSESADYCIVFSLVCLNVVTRQDVRVIRTRTLEWWKSTHEGPADVGLPKRKRQRGVEATKRKQFVHQWRTKFTEGKLPSPGFSGVLNSM
jgi:hypothetical protein